MPVTVKRLTLKLVELSVFLETVDTRLRIQEFVLENKATMDMLGE